MSRIIAVLFLVFLVSSCDDKRVFHQYKEVGHVWHKDSAVVFKVNQLDSLQSYNVFITLRNDNNYSYSNLFLITQMQFPHGRLITDTLQYDMARPDGSWLGTGFSDLKESKLWYKESVKFSESGEYTFKIKQAMRRNGDVDPVTALEGIRDVGLRIEKSNND
ncbi:gliding motility lipoprotein GldH [Leeuwenhoekiella sp. A16]|uniref:gliding motility lipoprotein GldH n=1 Tax=unclassified Leeuwenhoekiella TaxID=2615029 RepID=UPI003A7F7D8C